MTAGLHSWEDLGPDEGTDPFAPPDRDPRVRRWRCSRCGWELELSLDAPRPDPGKPFWRRLPGGSPEELDCLELQAAGVMES